MFCIVTVVGGGKKKFENTVSGYGSALRHFDLEYGFFSVALRPNAGHGLLILEVSRSHTTTQHSR